MSIRCSSTRIGRLGALVALLALAGCAGEDASRRLGEGYRLVQKGQFQALYRSDGRIVRLLQDSNHDGRADAVIVYWPNGTPERGELDTDGDGVVDRWEHFRTDGTLDRVDIDSNRDGTVDRTDYAQ